MARVCPSHHRKNHLNALSTRAGAASNFYYIYGGPADHATRILLTSIARGGGTQCLFDVTASRDPNETSVALTTHRRRYAPPPRNFYYVFGRPADHSKRRVLQLRVNLNLYSIFERLASPRRVRRAPHASAARSAAPAVLITFLGFPRTRLRVLDSHSGFHGAWRRREAPSPLLIRCLKSYSTSPGVQDASPALHTRRRLRVLELHSGFNVLFGFPANPRRVRRAPHALAARSAGPAIFITFLGFPRTRLRVLESHSGFNGARWRRKAQSPLLFDVRVLREPNDVLFALLTHYVLQNRTLGASMACGGGAQRCLQRLFDVRVSREFNDAPFALQTRRRRPVPPQNLLSHFWWFRGAQRRTQVLLGFPRTQDASAALLTRRRRVGPPLQFYYNFWVSRGQGYVLQVYPIYYLLSLHS
ncbi:hypothetical protein DFH09DRAFT_1452413 [Mycena vulgaris]|nr:hypothetical protein DFH09DRAFT_1452413 [Mycena vulgaris]